MDYHNCAWYCSRRHTSLFCLIFDLLLLVISSFFYLSNVLFVRQCGCLFFVSYFNDVCCGIWFLAYSNLLLGIRGKRIEKFWAILLYFFSWAIVWEFLGPVINEKSICDPFDFVAYMGGGIIYGVLLRIGKLFNNKMYRTTTSPTDSSGRERHS